MKIPEDSQFLDDPQFQSLLVSCMESLERGREIDRVALAKDFPRFAEPLQRFLEDRELLRNVAASFQHVDAAPASAFEKTVASGDGHDDFSDGDAIRYVGEYEILGEIARGGMGVVFKARQQSLHRLVALKMILAGRLADDADVERFRREAQAAGRLKHPNVVAVHEVGEHEGRHYFSMDFVDGRSLSDIVREAPLAPLRAARVMRSVAEAVEFAHQQGTLHRDLKPANVLLTADDVPHVTDFGLAKMLDSVDDDSRAELTASGQILGTPSHMSPEQAAGRQALVGIASDVYSLGSTLYACLTGRAPFAADSPVDTLLQVMHKEPVPPRLLNPAVPRDLETICLKCLHKEPHCRYGTAQLMADDLKRFLEGRPVAARPVSTTAKVIRWAKRNRAIAALLVLSVLLLAGGTAVSTYFAFEASARAEAESNERLRADHTVDLLRSANTDTKLALNRESRALAEMQAERDEAQRQRQLVESLLYATQLKAAKVDLNEGRLKEAREHLDSCRAGIRGWEHDYLSAVVTAQENGETPETLIPNPSIRRLPPTVDSSALMALSPDGKQGVVVGDGIPGVQTTQVPVIDVHTGDVVGTLAGHGARPSAAAYSPDGRMIVTGAYDGSVKVWNAETREELFSLPGHDKKLTTLAFHPDGRHIVSGSGEARLPPDPSATGQLIVYDVDERRVLWNLEGHPGVVTCAQFSPDGRWMASGGFGTDMSDSGKVRLWDAATGESVYVVDGSEIAVTSLAFSPDSRRLVVGGGLGVGEQNVPVLDVATGETILSLPDQRKIVLSVAFSPDGERIATLGGDQPMFEIRHVKLWDARSGIELLQLDVNAGLNRIFWEPNSDDILAIGRSLAKSAVVRWSAAQQEVLPKLIIRSGTASAASRVVFTPDGRQLVSGGQFQKVRLWDADSGDEVKTLSEHPGPINGVDISGDGNRIASTSHDALKVWDLKQNREVLSVDQVGNKFNFRAIACSPDGLRFVGGSTGGGARVWAVTPTFRGEISTLTGHEGTIRDVAFAPDGKRVATAGSDKTVRIWNAETGEEMVTFTGHTRYVTCVAFSPDGERVVSGGYDTIVRIWNADKGNRVTELEGHKISILSVAFSPDGKRIVSGAADKTIKVWDAETGKILATLTGHEAYVRSVAFSPDSSRIASSAGVEDMTIRIWPNPVP